MPGGISSTTGDTSMLNLNATLSLVVGDATSPRITGKVKDPRVPRPEGNNCSADGRMSGMFFIDKSSGYSWGLVSLSEDPLRGKGPQCCVEDEFGQTIMGFWSFQPGTSESE